MARKTNPKLIGGFVVGAIVLAIAGLMAFGGGEFLKPKAEAVIFFQGSLGGLDVGAPVTFRGVKIGTVTAIVIEYDVAKQVLHIPVYMQLEPEKLQIVSGERNEKKNLDALIARGLRGQLETVSLVTGQASINFDFHPETPVRLLGIKPGVQELPSIPSSISQLTSNVSSVLGKINSLPLDQLTAQLLDTIKSANDLIANLNAQVKPLGDKANDLVANLNAQVKPLSDNANTAINQATLTLQEAQKRLELREGEPLQTLNQTLSGGRNLVDNLNRDLPQLVAAAEQVMGTVTKALDQAQATLRTAQQAISPDSPLYYELNSTLRELKTAATAIRVFAEYIQRNPNALLTGNH
jgi:paraquat-inducible protein B